MAGGRNAVRAGRAGRAAASVVLLALATGCGGGGSSTGTTSTTGQTSVPTASSGTNANAIATLFPASKGHTTVTKAKVPTTPLGQQNHKVVLLTAPPESSGSSAGTGVTLGAAHLPAGSFSLAGNACTGQTLQPGQTCPLEIVFAPTSVGTHSAELTVDTSAGRADYRVELTGEGVASASGSASPTHTSRTPVVTSPAESSPAEATATASEG